ncbi:MAG: glucosamine-6-phosphate deaminase [bacterium]
MISNVEKMVLQKSPFKLRYAPHEKIGVIQVENFPELGKLAALRFLEWVQNNAGGVIALPTGKTPEYFIKNVHHYLSSWRRKNTQQELDDGGVDPNKKPDLRSLHFVQIDDFYPISPEQQNSFYYYVNKYYIEGFNLDPAKAMLIDCSKIGIPSGKSLQDIWPDYRVDLALRYRRGKNAQERLQKQVLEQVDQWCVDYEQRIRDLGGIGFFLGGIGPDGHIGFNVCGSDLFSTTRLTPTNYETQATAATDLGGIEISRNRLVITIGLKTITCNSDCVAIIIAAGEAKARIVADAVQHSEHIHFPATVLQRLPNARFYISRGAGKYLQERVLQMIASSEIVSDEQAEKIVVDLSLKTRKAIDQLTSDDFQHDRFARELLKKRNDNTDELKQTIRSRLIQKIDGGTSIHQNKIFLHTEPHHDDLMLGYLPYIVRHIREHSNRHFFATLTSGFTAVSNDFMLNLLVKLKAFLQKEIFDHLHKERYFDPENIIGKNRDIWQYLDGVAANRNTWKDKGVLRRLLRNLIFIYKKTDLHNLEKLVDELIAYFKNQYPGKKDLPKVQQLKGMCREFEADCLWGYFGWHSESVFHLRLGFYQGDIFTEEPTLKRDVAPVLEMLRQVRPDIISVALDPEASGPDTHYKVLQIMTEALKMYEAESGRSDLVILGYRNVWYRFHPCEADIFVPVSLNMFALQDNAFKNSFITQKDASFPSFEFDGPFSELAQEIQVEQYQMLKTCLGRRFFNEHQNALIRATRGIVFLKSMNLEEFYARSRELKKSTENL